MAVESNGRSAEAGKALNGHAKVPRTKSPTKQKGFSIFNTLSRLVTWYAIITILIRCPASVDLLTDTSPRICKPYFQIRNVVAPHLQPYYDAYASSYVEAARPYYNTLDKRVIAPATQLGKKYGAPRVAQAQAFGQAQWEKTLQPEVLKYQAIIRQKYDETLGPHVDAAIAAVTPYYEMSKSSALQTYYGHILPTYNTVQPYAVQGYQASSQFVVDTAIPFSKLAWETGVVFLNRTVLPRVKILYGENVEPQLVRIGERLGRYRDGKKLKAIVNEGENSSSVVKTSTPPSTTSTLSSIQPTISVSSVVDTTTDSETQAAAQAADAEKEVREKAKVVVAHDLKTWQEKFAKAADEGADDLEDRITEITERLVTKQADVVGKSLVIELEETVTSSLKTLKSSVIAIVKNSEDSEASEEAIRAAVRKAGVAIKDKAQQVRTWRQTFDQETNSLVSKTAQDTLDILDHIRDLGLQEIGMRWAWTDGVTHKDWAKYHKLKTKFDEWRYDVEKVATEHPGLFKARETSEEVESQAMALAEDAAKELARLKETSRWKLSAKDSSDDFNTKHMPVVAAVAAEKVAQKIIELSEAVLPSSQGTLESVASVASASISSQVENAQSVASSISEKVVGSSTGSVESIVSAGSASLSSVLDQASSSIIGTSQGTIESVTSVASETLSSIASKASTAVVGEESVIPDIVESATESVKSAASVVSESASSLSEVASSSISAASSKISSPASEFTGSAEDIPTSAASPLLEAVSESASSLSSAVSSATSSASKKVWGGAMAQKVEVRQIVYDDIIDNSEDSHFSEKLQSMASVAGDRYSDITKAVQEALLKPTSTNEYPVTKLAASRYSSALSAASAALYGTEQGTGESISSVVSSRYADAVSAASSVIYGTPVPITDSIAAQATDAYSAALSRAKQHYSQARSVVSAQISGTPKPVHEEMFSSVEAAYSDSVNAASSRLSAAVSAASTAVYGTPTGAYQAVYQSALAAAQTNLAEALSVVSSQYDEAKSYVAALNTPAPAQQRLLAQIQNQYYAGIGMAHARQSEFVAAVSSAVMPKQTPFVESLYNKASTNIVGTPTPAWQAALSTAASHYSNAVSGASSQLDQILASISKIGGDQKDIVPTASLAAMASSRYSAALAEASSSYSLASSVLSEKLASGATAASSAIIGTETPWTESVASAASTNWASLITKASSQIYGAPTPYFITRRLLSEAKEYASQASDGVASQYSAVQSLISELVVGKEPAFTESVYSRFSSAYYTGAGEFASSASSYLSETYESATSAAGTIFTPPPAIEGILDAASQHINEAVEAASIQLYGTSKGSYEQATSSAASVYSSVQSVASERIYGTPTGYVEAAQSSIAAAVSDAQRKIEDAVYGTKVGGFESVASVVGETVASATSVVGEQAASLTAKISSAVYGEEKGAVESAQARLSAAVEEAKIKLAAFAAAAGEGADEVLRQASEGLEGVKSGMGSVVESVTGRAKDEL